MANWMAQGYFCGGIVMKGRSAMVASAAMVLVASGACTTRSATSSACAPRRSPPGVIAYVTDYVACRVMSRAGSGRG